MMQFNRDGEVPPKLIALEGMNIAWKMCVHGSEKNKSQSSLKVVNLTESLETIRQFEDNIFLMVGFSSTFYV